MIRRFLETLAEWPAMLALVSLLILGLAGVADAVPLRSPAKTLFDRECSPAVVLGTASANESTVITGSSLAVNYFATTYATAEQTLAFEHGGEWSLGTTDEIEVCFNPPNGQPGTFWATWQGDPDYSVAVTAWFVFYISVGQGFDAGEQAGTPFQFQSAQMGGALNEQFARTNRWMTLNAGECIGLAVSPNADGTLHLKSWSLTIKQLGCREDTR